ncbi:hypothetical protein ACVR1I_07935 [Streptococcus cameli]
MAKKKINRKKLLKRQWNELKKAGKSLVGVAADKTQEALDNVAEATGNVVEAVTERVNDVVENVNKKTEKAKKDGKTVAKKAETVAKETSEKVKKETKKAASDFESFASSLEGVAAGRLETFYAEGIQSVKDFAKWTEKELLELKGIGPATIKQLKELNIKLKK